VWLGIGEALNEVLTAGKVDVLHDMYLNWPFFQVCVRVCGAVCVRVCTRTRWLDNIEREGGRLGVLLRLRVLFVKACKFSRGIATGRKGLIASYLYVAWRRYTICGIVPITQLLYKTSLWPSSAHPC